MLRFFALRAVWMQASGKSVVDSPRWRLGLTLNRQCTTIHG